MDRKIIKIIYKIRYQYGYGYHQVSKVRLIKKILKEKYSLIVKEKDISELVKKYMPSLKTDYTSYELAVMMRIYSDFYDTEKGIKYFNKRFNLSATVQGVFVLASRLGVSKKYKNQYKQSFISRLDEKDIASLYNDGLSALEIAKIYGYKNKKSILDKLKKIGVKRRHCGEANKSSRSYKGFDMSILDTKEKAYFLGLMITDGYVNEDRNYIQLALTDEDVIQYLSKYINCTYVLIEPKGKAKKIQYRFTLYGKEYVDQMRRFGLANDKSYSYKGFNILDEERKFIPDLIRGMIDGDGWIRKDGAEFDIVSASKDSLEWLKIEMYHLGFSDLNIGYIQNDYRGIYVIRSARKENIDILKTIIYKENYGMERKYNRLFGKNVQRA